MAGWLVCVSVAVGWVALQVRPAGRKETTQVLYLNWDRAAVAVADASAVAVGWCGLGCGFRSVGRVGMSRVESSQGSDSDSRVTGYSDSDSAIFLTLTRSDSESTLNPNRKAVKIKGPILNPLLLNIFPG